MKTIAAAGAALVAAAALAAPAAAQDAQLDSRGVIVGKSGGAIERAAPAGTSPFQPPARQAINHNSSRSNKGPTNCCIIAPQTPCPRNDWGPRPASGRTATLSRGGFSESRTSNASGKATFSYVAAGDYQLTVSPADTASTTVVEGTGSPLDCALGQGQLDCSVTIDRNSRVIVETEQWSCSGTDTRRSSSTTPRPRN